MWSIDLDKIFLKTLYDFDKQKSVECMKIDEQKFYGWHIAGYRA